MEASDQERWTLEDWGKLVLRISIAGLLLFHGIAKIVGGITGIAGMLQRVGLPGFVAYGVYVGEVIAPIMILLGFYARPAAIVCAFNMIVAILLAHSGDILKLGGHGEWAIELPMLYLLGAIAIALLGAGRITAARVLNDTKSKPLGGSAT